MFHWYGSYSHLHCDPKVDNVNNETKNMLDFMKLTSIMVLYQVEFKWINSFEIIG